VATKGVRGMIKEAINYVVEQWKDKFNEIDIQAVEYNELNYKVLPFYRKGTRVIDLPDIISKYETKEFYVEVLSTHTKDAHTFLSSPIEDIIPEGYKRIKPNLPEQKGEQYNGKLQH
jgi:hypothetical protein